MRAVLRLEVIGENYRQAYRQADICRMPMRRYVDILRYGRRGLRPWVARLIGLNEQFGFEREFLGGARDYRDADALGSRGIYEYYALADGLYEVNEIVRLGEAHRYFIRVANEAITEIDRKEAVRCLTNDTSA
jgi:hypothetical protein